MEHIAALLLDMQKTDFIMRGLVDIIEKHGSPELKRGVSGLIFRVLIALVLSILPKATSHRSHLPSLFRSSPSPPILSPTVFQRRLSVLSFLSEIQLIILLSCSSRIFGRR